MAKRKTKKKAAAKRPAAKKKTAKKTTKKATKKTAKKKTAKKAAKKAPAKATSKRIPPADKPRTKAEIFRLISESTELTKAQIASVFECMGEIIEKDLKKGGPGAVNLAGMMKVTVQRKPAVPRRKGINPFAE